jgi:hypothetical protein
MKLASLRFVPQREPHGGAVDPLFLGVEVSDNKHVHHSLMHPRGDHHPNVNRERPEAIL